MPTKTAKPTKTKKPRAGKTTTIGVFRVPVEELIDLPELAGIPTLHDAAVLDTDGEGPAGDWMRLYTSAKDTGKINENLKVVKLPDGKWAVADGRSRRMAAWILFTKEGDKRFAELKCEEISREEAEGIAIESLHRRHVPLYVIAYLECLKHEGQLTAAKRGRPTKAMAETDNVSQEGIARRIGCAVDTVTRCVGALRYFQERPADREKYEPRLLAGLMAPERVASAGGGAGATEEQPRKPSSFTSFLPKLSSFTSNVRKLYQWKPSDRENLALRLKKEVLLWPLDLREMIFSAVSAAGNVLSDEEREAAEKAAKKGGPKS